MCCNNRLIAWREHKNKIEYLYEINLEQYTLFVLQGLKRWEIVDVVPHEWEDRSQRHSEAMSRGKWSEMKD